MSYLEPEQCSSIPSTNDALLLVIIAAGVVFFLLYRICFKVPIGKNILCVNTHYIMFERLGVMTGGNTWTILWSFRQPIRNPNGSLFDLTSENFNTTIKFTNDYSDIGIKFELLFDIKWIITDIGRFVPLVETYIFNKLMYSNINLDGLVMNIAFCKFVKDTILDSMESKDDPEFVKKYISSFDALEKIGVKVIDYKQKPSKEVIIYMDRKRNDEDFEKIKLTLADKTLFPYG